MTAAATTAKKTEIHPATARMMIINGRLQILEGKLMHLHLDGTLEEVALTHSEAEKVGFVFGDYTYAYPTDVAGKKAAMTAYRNGFVHGFNGTASTRENPYDKNTRSNFNRRLHWDWNAGYTVGVNEATDEERIRNRGLTIETIDKARGQVIREPATCEVCGSPMTNTQIRGTPATLCSTPEKHAPLTLTNIAQLLETAASINRDYLRTLPQERQANGTENYIARFEIGAERVRAGRIDPEQKVTEEPLTQEQQEAADNYLAAKVMMNLGPNADVIHIVDKGDRHEIKVIAGGPINGEQTLRDAAERAGCKITILDKQPAGNAMQARGNADNRHVLNTFITAKVEAK